MVKPSPDHKAFFLGGAGTLGGSRLTSHGERNYTKLLEIHKSRLTLQASSSINFNERMMVSITSFMFLVWPIPFSGWRKRKCDDLAFRDAKGLCIHGPFKLKAYRVELASIPAVQAKCRSLRQEVEEHAALRNKAKNTLKSGWRVSLDKTVVNPFQDPFWV